MLEDSSFLPAELARPSEFRAPLKENAPDRAYGLRRCGMEDGSHRWPDGDPNDSDWHSKTRTPYGSGIEAKRITHQIGDFNYQQSKAYELVTRCFGHALRAAELRGLINAIIKHCQDYGTPLPPFTRSYRRSYVLMLKYIQENYDVFEMILPNVKLLDESNRVIGPDKDEADPVRLAPQSRRAALIVGQQ